MIGRKLYKTKLCMLFQRGRCPRQSCNFAHGEAELRRFGGSFNGRRDHRSGDLRDKLDRRHSPHRRLSPGRDARAHHTFRHQKPISRDRGSSLSRSPIRRNERRHRKKQHLDGESDVSESFKASDGPEDRKKEEKTSSYDDKDGLEEQLKQLQLDIEILDDHKSQLEIFLDEKVDEAHKLSSRLEDLESQLSKEQEDCRRLITSKIKKFIKAHGRYIKAQEELKRSQARLQKIGDQLSSDNLKLNANEDDPSVNVISDGEPNDDGKMSPRNNDLSNVLSVKKRSLEYPATSKEVKNGNSRKRERDLEVIFKSEKFSRFEGPVPQSETVSKGTEMMKTILTRNKSVVEDYKNKQGRSGSSGIASLDKGKGSEVRHSLPLTSMAAHAADEFIEAIEMDEKPEATENNKVSDNDDVDYGTKSAYMPPPPPPVTQNAYKQYEGDDEEVDVEKVDSEMLDIDINSEVDIEQV